MDRFELYELCVQAPAAMASFLRAAHGADPRRLREDFSGRGALSHAWVASDPKASALAVDLDAEVHRAAAPHARIERRHGDALAGTPAAADGPFDVIHAGNFSLGYATKREDLARYLTAARAALAPSGILVFDTFGGAGAFRLGASERRLFLDDGRRVSWLWQRVVADAASARIVSTLSFRVDRDGEVLESLPDAFVYRWRLWSLPELADLCGEAGCSDFAFYTDLDARPRRARGSDLPEDFSVCCVARR